MHNLMNRHNHFDAIVIGAGTVAALAASNYLHALKKNQNHLITI